MAKDLETEQTDKDWHSGFAAGLELSFRKYRKGIEIEREHPLSKEPLRIDFILLKKDVNLEIDNSLGKLFRRINIIEYKNPNDDLNIDVIWKIIGYTGIYKSQGNVVDEISYKDITITMVRSRKPVKVFESLCAEAIPIKNPYPGVYYIEKLTIIPTQVIVTSELKDDELLAIRILREKTGYNEVMSFVAKAKTYKNQGDAINVSSVLHICAAANKELFDKIRGEKAMRNVLKEIMREDFEEDILEAKIDGDANGYKRYFVTKVCQKLRRGKGITQIAEELEENETEVRAVCDVASKFAPEYDENKVFEEFKKNMDDCKKEEIIVTVSRNEL